MKYTHEQIREIIESDLDDVDTWVAIVTQLLEELDNVVQPEGLTRQDLGLFVAKVGPGKSRVAESARDFREHMGTVTGRLSCSQENRAQAPRTMCNCLGTDHCAECYDTD